MCANRPHTNTSVPGQVQRCKTACRDRTRSVSGQRGHSSHADRAHNSTEFEWAYTGRTWTERTTRSASRELVERYLQEHTWTRAACRTNRSSEAHNSVEEHTRVRTLHTRIKIREGEHKHAKTHQKCWPRQAVYTHCSAHTSHTDHTDRMSHWFGSRTSAVGMIANIPPLHCCHNRRTVGQPGRTTSVAHPVGLRSKNQLHQRGTRR